MSAKTDAANCYRTVSKEGLRALTGVLPIDLKALKRRDMYWAMKRLGHRVREIKEMYLNLLQDRWDASEKGACRTSMDLAKT